MEQQNSYINTLLVVHAASLVWNIYLFTKTRADCRDSKDYGLIYSIKDINKGWELDRVF